MFCINETITNLLGSEFKNMDTPTFVHDLVIVRNFIEFN